jgi:hypothetical protein
VLRQSRQASDAHYPTEPANAGEAAETIMTAEIIEAVGKLLPNLGFF